MTRQIVRIFAMTLVVIGVLLAAWPTLTGSKGPFGDEVILNDAMHDFAFVLILAGVVVFAITRRREAAPLDLHHENH